ncbi:DUF4177 domain-containing protein [Rubellimicrobium arenae]|uniref:DUF4177 domain-containing protein n=1 Tax=Rubellimicrobium arenae TaxID=2817372 RepID=UPI001B313806|nr:DUF4177 domain-containing protein [Rubellimicrobium arenae]
MQSHEYRVIPAPRRGVKVKGARTPEDRFARAVEAEMNRMAQDGWEFVRSDTLPCEQRQGWFGGRVTVFQTMLVFRRVAHEADRLGAGQPVPLPALVHSVPTAPVSPMVAQRTPPLVREAVVASPLGAEPALSESVRDSRLAAE